MNDVTAPGVPDGPARASSRRPAVALGAFLLAHVWLAVAGIWVAPDIGFYDLEWYRHWVYSGLTGAGWPVLDGPWVYPVGALAPMLVADVGGASATGYAVAWCVMVTAADLAACAMLVRRRGGVAGAWWWTAFLLLLGPVAVARLDAVVVPLVVVALLCAFDRPAVATALVTVGAWIKVAPGVVVLPLLATARRPWARVVVPAALVSAGIAGLALALGSGGDVASFLGEQGDRGLQLEAVAGTPWLLASLVDARSAPWPNSEINTWEIVGPGTALVADVLGVAFPLALAAAGALLWWRRSRLGPALWRDPGERAELLVRGALFVTLTAVVFNKVGSPQFMCWLAAPVAVAVALALPGWRPVAGAVLAVVAATQVFFPWLYAGIPAGVVGTTLVLAARNLLVVGLWAATLRRLLVRPGGRTGDVPPVDGGSRPAEGSAVPRG